MKKSGLLLGLVLVAACATRSTTPVYRPPDDPARYHQARAALVADERARRLGASLVLSADEEAADRRLKALRDTELSKARAYFPPAHNYLHEKTKQLIAESPVLAVMRRMPKGGTLHAHGSALGDYRWLASRAVQREDSYVYLGSSPTVLRHTLRLAGRSPGEGWRLISELRSTSNTQGIEEEIFKAITLGEEDLAVPDIWQEFTNIFRRVGGLLDNGEFFAAYWRQVLDGLIDENIQYLESRTFPFDRALMDEARARDPEFDVKFIPAAGRAGDRTQVAQTLKLAVEARVKDPERVKGFDLVNEEDRNNTNLFYIEELLAARRQAAERGVGLPLFLHSGESNWAENENLYDAVLLGATRIGHGLALFKHPLLMELVRARDIAIEVCPISNQVLGYVADLRTHPAVHYINSGLPVVLSSDDPGIMQHTLSHDFYAAFMAWGLDLRALKQLALNSLTYSTMEPPQKRRAIATWEGRWKVFIAWVNSELR